MSYQVLARKWRPRTFREMVGQEHVLRALVNALERNQLHHAYLFTGTRGVGKTTVARIFAKSINCEANGISAEPCGECSTCREIDTGRFVDLVEVDAASRTKVDETRELLENVQYMPTKGRYKVYLIDEVHMFSNHSFNALLKTLEEPPEHVKFLLATTDPQKLPVTIRSRCLQFNLKRIPQTQIEAYLQQLLEKEQIVSEGNAIVPVARAAEGSMRDALSLLDQAIAFGGGTLREADINAMLGTIEQRHLLNLLNALAAQDGAALLEEVERISEQAVDFSGVLTELVAHLHRIAVMQAIPTLQENDEEPELAQLADQLSPEDVQLFYQIAVNGRRDFAWAADPKSGLEMVLLRMLAFRPLAAQAEPKASEKQRAQASAQKSVQSKTTAKKMPEAQSHVSGIAEPQAESFSASVSSSTVATTNDIADLPQNATGTAETIGDWETTVQQLQLRGLALQLAQHCILKEQAKNRIMLELHPEQAVMRNENAETRIQETLSNYLGRPIQLKIVLGEQNSAAQSAQTPAARAAQRADSAQQQAEATLAADSVFQSMQEKFDGKIVEGSVRPTSQT